MPAGVLWCVVVVVCCGWGTDCFLTVLHLPLNQPLSPYILIHSKSLKGGSMVEEEQLTTVVAGDDGHDYFQIVRDERRGDDRRSDGRLNAESNADFFSV